MISLGFMTLDLHNEHSYFTEIAKRAHNHHIICYRFIPSKINPITEIIEGEIYDANNYRWTKKSFYLPDVLYDRCFYGDDFHSKQCKAIINWIKGKENIQFLGFGFPNKLELYEVLYQSKLSAYLPKTVSIVSTQTVDSYVKELNKIIIKPIDGAQGNGVYLIEKENINIIVKTDKEKKQVSRTFSKHSTYLSWLERVLSKREYLLQPFLSLQNENNQPFDIRSLLQRDQHGNWITVGKGIREGRKDGIVSNLSLGGTVIPFEAWSKGINEPTRNFVIEEIEDILQNLPPILENHFSPLFELGVDIGVARDGSVWILDINSKPGRKVLLLSDPELKEYLYESPLLYTKWLMERRENTHEKTLSD